MGYFDVIRDASMDMEGLSVRRRALKILWECCILCPGFPHELAIEAIILILNRAGDSEESMRKQAALFCTELWFSPGSALGERVGGLGLGSGLEKVPLMLMMMMTHVVIVHK